MNANTCASPTFKEPPPKKKNTVKNIPESVEKSLQEAVHRLKKEMENVEPPRPIIEVQGEVEKCMVVKEVGKFLEIHRNTDILYRTDKSIFRHVQFSLLKDCRVFVLTKTVRVFFMRCEGCQFSIRSPLIGKLEFFKCANSKVNIRISCRNETLPIPLIMVEDCHEFHIYQSNSELFYVIMCCERITGTIIDPKTNERLAKYQLGKVIWDWQERSVVMLSRDKGFASVPDSYSISDVSHHLFLGPNNDLGGKDQKIEDLFGTTPPSAKGFL